MIITWSVDDFFCGLLAYETCKDDVQCDDEGDEAQHPQQYHGHEIPLITDLEKCPIVLLRGNRNPGSLRRRIFGTSNNRWSLARFLFERKVSPVGERSTPYVGEISTWSQYDRVNWTPVARATSLEMFVVKHAIVTGLFDILTAHQLYHHQHYSTQGVNFQLHGVKQIQ